MMFVRSLLVVALAAGCIHAGEKKTDESLAQAKAAVEKQVADWKGEGARIAPIDETYLRDVFANHRFVAAHFPIWPIALDAPKPMKSQNLFAVSKEGKVTHLPDVKKLEEFFQSTLVEKPGHSSTVKSWLRLRVEYLQDGYYKFKAPTVGFPLMQTITANDMIPGEIEVVPEMGNKGSLKSTIVFASANAGGKFLSAKDTNEVIRGIRPRCQATLLLHPERLVREIVEQDLLVMGRLAKGYLMDQRAKASEELRREIDRVWQQIEADGR